MSQTGGSDSESGSRGSYTRREPDLPREYTVIERTGYGRRLIIGAPVLDALGVEEGDTVLFDLNRWNDVVLRKDRSPVSVESVESGERELVDATRFVRKKPRQKREPVEERHFAQRTPKAAEEASYRRIAPNLPRWHTVIKANGKYKRTVVTDPVLDAVGADVGDTVSFVRNSVGEIVLLGNPEKAARARSIHVKERLGRVSER